MPQQSIRSYLQTLIFISCFIWCKQWLIILLKPKDNPETEYHLDSGKPSANVKEMCLLHSFIINVICYLYADRCA